MEELCDGTERDWLALQCGAWSRPRDAVELLKTLRAPRRALERLPGASAPSPRRLRSAECALARAGGRLVPWGSADYPPRLAPLADAPPVLGVRGDVDALVAPAVAIVGSRAASAYGLEVARRVASELARAGVVVVSGLAYGIDAAAHGAALDAGGRSIAVQACGLDRVYPARHRRLADRLAAHGAVVSEFPPGLAPRPGFFPLRNRLITGLASALVVVEARERSGSLVSARHAADQGVEVFAVPGPITLPGHAGSNRLLRDGAWPLLEPRDVLDVLGWCAAPSEPRGAAPASATGKAILAALRHEPAASDALARRLGCDASRVASELLALELDGRVARDRDGRWRAAG